MFSCIIGKAWVLISGMGTRQGVFVSFILVPFLSMLSLRVGGAFVISTKSTGILQVQRLIVCNASNTKP